MAKTQATYSIETRGARIYATTPYSRAFVADAKRLTGHKWHSDSKEWSFPAFLLIAVTKLCSDIFGAPSVTEPEDPLAWGENRVYGCALEKVWEIFTTSSQTRDMVVMSILSDAQEAMMSGDIETARQYINRAKYGVMEFLAPVTTPRAKPVLAIVLDDKPDSIAEIEESDSEMLARCALVEDETIDPELGF